MIRIAYNSLAMDQLSVIESLRFYARVRGVSDVEHNVTAVIRAVGLQNYSSRMAAKLSGGNKRKLSLGIALMGNPSVLLLDEPSSGMDAAAKRIMWKTLTGVVVGRSILLTTHSMEEAGALASRVGIMSKRMLALGTPDYLRQKHGNAYHCHLVMKTAPGTTADEMMRLRGWVIERFPGADVDAKMYHGQMRFAVPVRKEPIEKQTPKTTDGDEIRGDSVSAGKADGGGIGSILATLEEHKDELGIGHYSVSPTTLDQVFLSIVERHNVEEENYAS
jgi:ATP-binding cassette, subfamily A (ABC1), member 3